MIDLKTYVKFLSEKNITPEEFIFLYFVYMINEVDKRYETYIKIYTDRFGVEEDGRIRVTSHKIKRSLVDKGFLIISNDGLVFKDYKVTNAFKSDFIDPYEQGNEMIDTYPDRAIIKGVSIPIKTMDRNLARTMYADRIKGSMTEHKEILLDIKWAIANNLVNMSFENFIASEQWRDWRKARKSNNKGVEDLNQATDNDF